MYDLNLKFIVLPTHKNLRPNIAKIVEVNCHWVTSFPDSYTTFLEKKKTSFLSMSDRREAIETHLIYLNKTKKQDNES